MIHNTVSQELHKHKHSSTTLLNTKKRSNRCSRLHLTLYSALLRFHWVLNEQPHGGKTPAPTCISQYLLFQTHNNNSFGAWKRAITISSHNSEGCGNCHSSGFAYFREREGLSEAAPPNRSKSACVHCYSLCHNEKPVFAQKLHQCIRLTWETILLMKRKERAYLSIIVP